MVLLGGLVYGIYYWLVLSHYESTDNAYVQGNVVQVTPQVSGTVVAINADDTDFVKAGQSLVKLDPADAQVALEQAEAQLAQTVRESRTTYINNGTFRAQIAAREADVVRAQSDVARAQDDVTRRAPLVRTGAVGQEEFNHANAQLAAARSSLAAAQSAAQAAREQLVSNQSLTENVPVDQNPNVLRAAARVREAYLALRRTELLAPLDGYVARRSVQLGQRVQAGTPLLSVVPLSDVWVDANFKEGQLRNLRIGQPVELEADVYGKKVDLSRHDRRSGRRHRRGVLAAAGAERDRQLDQGRAARAGADRARPEGSHGASAAGRPVDGCEGRRQPTDGRVLADTTQRAVARADEGVRQRRRAGRRRGEPHHRQQPRAPRGREHQRAPGGRGAQRRVVGDDIAGPHRCPLRWPPRA